VPEQVAQLFAEYADAYARGERPRAEEYLARAGAQADELAGLLERFVQGTPARTPDAATLALTEAWLTGEPPLVVLRASRGVLVDEVVDALVERLGLDPAKRVKVKRYYERLEQGLLEPRRVSRRVWAVVSALVGREARQQADRQPPRAALSATPYGAETPIPLAAPERARREEEDEIDFLFHGGDD